MFTLSQARGFIGSAADFARGGAYVQEGRVSGVTAGEHGGLLRYSGIVRAAGQEYAVSFDYDEPPSFYKLEIYYKDGRSETLFDKISIE